MSMKKEDKQAIEEALDIELCDVSVTQPIPGNLPAVVTPQVESVPAPIGPVFDKNLEDDFALAREKIQKIVQDGSSAIDDMIHMARESEAPQMITAVSSYLKTIADAAKSLMDIHEKLKNIKEMSGRPTKHEAQAGTINVDKAVFIGSTEDIIKKIREIQDESKDVQRVPVPSIEIK